MHACLCRLRLTSSALGRTARGFFNVCPCTQVYGNQQQGQQQAVSYQQQQQAPVAQGYGGKLHLVQPSSPDPDGAEGARHIHPDASALHVKRACKAVHGCMAPSAA